MGAKEFVGGVVVGAGLVYYLDAEHGAERRARLRVGRGAGAAVSERYGSRLGDIDGLAAANLPHRRPGTDTDRILRVVGGALVAWGLLRRGAMGGLLRTLGIGIAAVGAPPSPSARTAPGARERRRTVDIQKTLHVDAPIDRVYAFWSSYENFPLFMSDVRAVRDLGNRRSRWTVAGPGGAPIAWTAVITEQVPGRLLAWRSEPGALLENAGVVRFAPEGAGTRVDVRFCYSPPVGRTDSELADFFGADPRARINEDLGRLKALLESP
jgi:uncharacterized membrane protein